MPFQKEHKINLTHGHAKRGKKPKTYWAWKNMRQRCNNPNYRDYKYYGGRNITICERWNKFENFLTDMGECSEGLMLDRIDNNGNYELSNCHWVDIKTSNRNMRTVKLSMREVQEIRELYSEGYKQNEIAEQFNVSQQIVSNVVNRKSWV